MADFGREMDEADPDFVRGYVKASDPGGQRAGDARRARSRDPSLLVAVRKQYGIWQDRVERESRDPVDATVARLAADGLWLAELSAWVRPRVSSANGYSNVCWTWPNLWIDSSVNG